MLPPRLLRRVVLAPLVIALAVALVVLSPLIALLTATFSLVRRSPSGRMRGIRLLLFAGRGRRPPRNEGAPCQPNSLLPSCRPPPPSRLAGRRRG